MKLTRAMIMEARTPRGAWNKPQLAAIGVAWPPTAGWIIEVGRREYPEETIARFKMLSTAKHKGNKIDPPDDKNVLAVREKLLARMKTGIRKYGVTTERADLSQQQWLQHAQEEALDLAVYLERLMQAHPL